jgi:ubiquinone/menaquinone biosynthesis C-methylase UbiE
MTEIKQEVRQFYDQVGWKQVSHDVYQNAHYEDLRPVSREYIHRCHMRVKRHLEPTGRFLLDAGSGPIQYPEYLTYSDGYQYRVCADISITALREARQRIAEHGLYVVADIANLPFKDNAFDGIVTLHTIHHLPEKEHMQAYTGLYRVLKPQKTAIVVNGWASPPLMKMADPFIRTSNRIRGLIRRILRKPKPTSIVDQKKTAQSKKEKSNNAKGTFTNKHDVDWVKKKIGSQMPLEILVWRSVSVRFLRSLIHPMTGGRWWLRLLYWLEECFPHYFGEKGQYPLIVIRKD